MITREIWNCLEKLYPIAPTAFVNLRQELIVHPKSNTYFLLSNIKTELDFKCKMVAWLSRPAHKGLSKPQQKQIQEIFNCFMGTEFTHEDFSLIYGPLGNGCNSELCIQFVKSGCDLEVLRK